MSLRVQLVEDLETLETLTAEWDGLAVAAGRPYCAPAWMLAWWRHCSPPGSSLRVIVAFDRDALAGVAPFFVEAGPPGLRRCRLLASGVSSPLEPLAREGLERDCAQVFAAALAAARPRANAVTLEGVSGKSPWPRLLADAWPAKVKPVTVRTLHLPAPTVTLRGENLDEFLATKSSSFRQQMRRRRRNLVSEGARFRVSSAEELPADLKRLARLHHGRWDPKGGSTALDPAVERMLGAAGRELVALGRFRVWSIDIDGSTISSHLMVAAGRELAYWLGGIDDSRAKQSPGLITLLHATEDALRRGERRFDLGSGGQDYKLRLADDEDHHDWLTLVPPGPGYALVRAHLRLLQLRYAATARLSDEAKARLRRLARLARRRGG